MPRVTRGFTSHRRHSALLERAKGFRNGRRSLVKRATEALLKAGQYAYRDRRTKKRDFRRGWIVTVNAAARAHGLTYSTFMAGLKREKIEVNRKMLAELAVSNPAALESLIAKVSK